MENKIYKEAILDAKALRAGAIANAKSIMQEALEPAIQEMMRLKLSEELEEDLEETYEEGTQEEGYTEEGAMNDKAMYEDEDEDGDTEITDETLEEILAELNALEEDQLNEVDEADKIEEADEDDQDEDDDQADVDADDMDDADDAIEDEPVSDETKVIQLTLGDLKAALMASQPEGPSEEEPIGDDKPVSLDEILAELEEAEKQGKEKGIEEGDSQEEELKLAKETIETLQESIKEINLLNAKLLYMNKIFKAKSLTESEKIKVVKAFDRNSTVSEVKNTYETLKESIQSRKSQIKESIGFASKPVGVAPKTNIVEADAFVSRWQKIAGIK
jgi:hypothetical protein